MKGRISAIIWQPEAKSDYTRTIDYLLENWSRKQAQDFVERVGSILELLRRTPFMAAESDYKHVRKLVIRKQISLYYLVENDKIFVLRFWDNRQDPDALILT